MAVPDQPGQMVPLCRQQGVGSFSWRPALAPGAYLPAAGPGLDWLCRDRWPPMLAGMACKSRNAELSADNRMRRGRVVMLEADCGLHPHPAR
jgi:hypothetical protein